MHKHQDQMAKRIAVEIYDAYGLVQPEKEVPSPEAQHMDLWFQSHEELPPEEELPSFLRVPVRMGRRSAHFEFCSAPVDSAEMRHIQRKKLVWHHQRCLAARKERKPEPPLFPTWSIMPGKPVAYFGRRRVRRATGWPRGFYSTDEESELWFVVVSELPRTRQTLVLRLLGSEHSRRQALAEVGRIRADDPELPKLLAVVKQLWKAVERDKNIPEPERTQFMTEARAETLRENEELRAEGRAEGRREGMAEARAAVYDLCDVLKVSVTAPRREQAEKMSLDELRALRQHVKNHQSWPSES